MTLRQDGPDAKDTVMGADERFTREWFLYLKDDRWKETAAQAIVNGAVTSVAHGFQTTPNEVTGYLKCLTAELGFAVGDRVALPVFEDGGVDYGIQFYWNGTYAGFTVGASGVRLMNRTTGALTTITNGSWAVVLRGRP